VTTPKFPICRPQLLPKARDVQPCHDNASVQAYVDEAKDFARRAAVEFENVLHWSEKTAAVCLETLARRPSPKWLSSYVPGEFDNLLCRPREEYPPIIE